MFVQSYEIFEFFKLFFVNYFPAFVYYDNKKLLSLALVRNSNRKIIFKNIILYYFTFTGIYSFSLPQGCNDDKLSE